MPKENTASEMLEVLPEMIDGIQRMFRNYGVEYTFDMNAGFQYATPKDQARGEELLSLCLRTMIKSVNTRPAKQR